MKQEEKNNTGLPDNAFRPLSEGEEYRPLMSPDKVYPEVNFWSVSWGIAMAVLFSAAAAYLGLKVGQVFEAAIPIAIIAVGMSTQISRNDSEFHADVHQFIAWRYSWHFVPDTFP